jgi:hypothetical protein
MRTKTTPVVATILLGVALATACGGDSSGPEDVTLSQAASIEIASTLMTEIITIGFSALSGTGSEPAARSADTSLNLLVPISATVPCGGGGTITVQGNYSNNVTTAGTGSISFDLHQTPNSCVMATSQGAFTVSGNPELAIGGTLTVSAWTLGIYNFIYQGGFRWTGPGGSGTCNMNLTYNFNYANSSFSASGHMCNYEINWNYTA